MPYPLNNNNNNIPWLYATASLSHTVRLLHVKPQAPHLQICSLISPSPWERRAAEHPLTLTLLHTPKSPTSSTTMSSVSLSSFLSCAQHLIVFQNSVLGYFPTIKVCFSNLSHSWWSTFISLYISIFNPDSFQFAQPIYSNALQMSPPRCSLATLVKYVWIWMHYLPSQHYVHMIQIQNIVVLFALLSLPSICSQLPRAPNSAL